jgi:hypothetical protein
MGMLNRLDLPFPVLSLSKWETLEMPVAIKRLSHPNSEERDER